MSEVEGDHFALLEGRVDGIGERVSALEQELRQLAGATRGRDWCADPDRASEPASRADAPPRAPQRNAAVPPSAPPPVPRPVAPARAPRPARSQQHTPARTRLDLEDFLGGRVLAWAGAITVLIGVVFLVAVAIGRGWIDESARIALGFGVSSVLLAGGAWLHEQRGRTQASLAIVGSGLAGAYLTLTAGVQLYHLYPPAVALGAALVIGAAGTVLAVRWNSRTVAALAIGGALLAPALTGADPTTAVAGFLLVALASAVGVLVMRRWDWLAVGCFVIAAPQLLWWVSSEHSALALIGGLSAYALINAAAAFGYELRVESKGLRPSATLLVLGGALVTAAGGYYGLRHSGNGSLAEWWIAVLAVAHFGAAVIALQSPRIGREIGLVTAAAGAVLADVAFGTIADGPGLAAGWGASAAALAALVRARRADVELTRLALGGQLCLALMHVLLFDAAPGALGAGVHDLPVALVGIGSVSLTAFVCARLDSSNRLLAAAFDALALAGLAYASAYALDGPVLVATWIGFAVSLAGFLGRERVAAAGAVSFVALAGLHAVAIDHQPESLLYGSRDLGTAACVLAAIALGSLAVARQVDLPELPEVRAALRWIGAITLLYLVSLTTVTAFQPTADAVDTGLALGVRQQGQVLLSCLWAITGVTALVLGLRRTRRELRLAGFALLALAFAKVIVFDLATLDSIYRVASCVALGLLLLGSAFAYQRIRPRGRQVA